MNIKQTSCKLIVVGLGLSIGLTCLGLGQAPKANAMSSKTAARLIHYADNYMGTPYQFGVSTATTDYFDCSSFTMRVYKKFGYELPRTAREQARVGRFIAKPQLKEGDLVFFRVPSRGSIIGHVGIYVGKGKMLNAYGAGGVKLTRLDSGYWKAHYVTARRLGS
ncbi:NlpC/P60 family protein [Paenibacillus sp. UNC496MF]|uniref:C40 family peptidase n=1 Tax=Paenibacillus sp. UNC496MF TaxID=1502753 RepID=UPI0008F24E00|nr:C40 family peptidase [Paenibacillus sp. UNC496MF]SFJ36815.1 NlpC/P60 family protein [Paenibacillus sp. UNC496MF]